VADPAIGVVRGELTDSSNLIVDPALQARLEAEHADLLYRRQGVNYPPTLERIDQELTANAAAQAANRGPSFQAQRDLRTRGRNRGGIDVLGERVGDASYAAKTATMRQAAADRGLAGVFDATETEASRLLRQRDALKELLPNDNNVRPTGQEGFNSLFSKSGAGDLEQLGALLEHAPAETGQAFADRFELAGRGKVSAGTQDVNPAAYDPSRIVQLWDNASPEARDAYAPPGTPLRRYVEAQVAVNRADTLRTAARTKPGRGSNTLGGPQRFFTNPLTLATGGAAAGALSFGVPGLGALVGLLPSATARFFGSRLTDPRFVERIIHPPTVGESLSLPRILGAAVGEQDPNRDPRKLLNTAGTAAGRAARYPYP
jgi:hypothetical protein